MENWLKICKDTASKPKLHLLAKRLNCSKGDVFLYCFNLWAWADSQTTDGFIPNTDAADVAELAHVPLAFCHALAAEDVGWLIEFHNTKNGQQGMLLHDWQKHNGSCSKKRAQAAARQSRYRGRSKGK